MEGVSFHGNIIKGFEEPAFLVEMGRDYGRPFPTCQLLNILFFVSVPCPILVAAVVSATVSFCFSHDEESVIYVAIKISMII